MGAVWKRCVQSLLAVTVLGAVLAVVVAGRAGALDGVWLLSRPAAVGFEAGAIALLLASWLRGGRRWARRILPLLLAGSAVAVGATALVLRVTGIVTDPYPMVFAVWVFIVLAAAATCSFLLSRGTVAAWRRGASAVAVPLAVAGCLMLIEQHYGIWPTVGDLLGHNEVVGGARARQLIAGTDQPFLKGLTVEIDPPATRSHFRHRAGVAYLPPAYFGAGRDELPVLIMLVGTPGSPVSWLTAGHARDADRAYAAAHQGFAPVLIAVDHNGSTIGDTECVDGPQGNAETYLTVDVPAFVTGTLRLSRNPDQWGIVGYSEGGTCAIDLALGHPDIYRHVVDLAGDLRPTLGGPRHTRRALFGGSLAAERAHDPTVLLTQRRYPELAVWFVAGRHDPRRMAAAKQLAAAAQGAGARTYRFVGIGGHSWQFAGDAFARILPQLYGGST